MSKKTTIKKGRSALKSYFETGNMPTEEQLVHFIDSKINQGDDQIAAVDQENGRVYLGLGTSEPKKPITIQAHRSEQSLLSLKDPLGSATWNLDQRTTVKPGLNINHATTNQSQLFIQKATGNIGINSIEPQTKLEIDGALSSRDTSRQGDGALHLGQKNEKPGAKLKFQGESGSLDFTTASIAHEALTIHPDKNVGVLTNDPKASLHINGNLKLKNGASVKSFSPDGNLTTASHDQVPTEKAIKHFLLNSRRFNGTWSSETNRRNSRTISTVSNSTHWRSMSNMNMTIYTTGSPFLVSFKAGGVQSTGVRKVHAEFRMLINGIQKAYCHHEFHTSGWELRDVSLFRLFNLPAGTYTIRIEWSVRSPSAIKEYWYTVSEKRTRRKKWKFGPFSFKWGRETYYVNVQRHQPNVWAYLTTCWGGANRSLTAMEL